METILRRRLRESDPAHVDTSRAQELQLERLPYCVSGAYWALLEVGRLLADLGNTRSLQLGSPEATQLVLSADETLFVRHAIDSYLDVACRAQDAILAYVTATLHQSLPASLSKCVRAMRRGTLKGNPWVEATIEQYWATSGERLRQYRDLAQHHAVVSSEGVVVRTGGGHLELALFLPANPEVKSPADWHYDDPDALAYPYCCRSYVALFGFIYRLLYILARHLGFTESFTRRITFRAPLSAARRVSHPVPEPGDLAAVLIQERQLLKAQCEAEYGKLSEPAIGSDA